MRRPLTTQKRALRRRYRACEKVPPRSPFKVLVGMRRRNRSGANPDGWPVLPTGAKAARSVFGCSCGRRAGPGRERVPFGLSHAALFITDFDKNKRSVVLPGLRSSECGRKSVRVPDSCFVRQVNLLTRFAYGIAAADQLKMDSQCTMTDTAISRAMKTGSSTGGTSHSRSLDFGISDIQPPAWLRREQNALSHR